MRERTYVSRLGTNLALESLVHLLELVEGLGGLEIVIQQLLDEWSGVHRQLVVVAEGLQLLL